MITKDKIQSLFASDYLSRTFVEGDHATAEAALPDASLEFLVEVCQRLQIRNVFEFGSGRSTLALLQAGFNVVSLEDSQFWLDKTIQSIPLRDSPRHRGLMQPLQTKALGCFPVMDWKLSESVTAQLGAAELILVDSPHYTPFRESTLWTSLTVRPGALVILDDTRIPTLRHFCDRLARTNRSLLHRRIAVGHGFDLFYRYDQQTKLSLGHSMTDCLRGWRRYFLGRIFYAKLASSPSGDNSCPGG